MASGVERSAGATAPAATSTGVASERLLLAAVALGGLLAPLNSTMIAVALPDIRSEFALSHGAIAWLVSSYLITMAVAQPVAGSLGDQLGRERIFRVALVAFLAFSLGATLAPSFESLVALRTGQAVAGAALIPNGMAMLRAVVPPRRLGRVNGLFGSAMAVSAASGPLIGAALLDASSWRLLFLLNVPAVGLALLLHARLRYRDDVAVGRVEIDWAGAALLAAMLTGITWLLAAFNGEAGGAATAAVSAGVLITSVAFVRRQVVGRVAVAPWGLFRRRSFAAANGYIMLSYLVMYTALLTIPFFIREVQEGGHARIGLLLGAMSFLMAALAPLSGRLSDAVGRRGPAVAGAVLALAGALLLVTGIDAGVSFATLAGALALLGAGIGLGTGAATTAAIESVPRALAGSAAGTNSMMRYIGSIAGVGVIAGLLGGGEPVPSVEVFRAIFAVVASMALVAVISATAIHTRVGDDPG